METATAPSPPALADRIALLIDEMVEMVRLFAGMPIAPRFLTTIVLGRVQRLAERFARLAGRIRAGTVRPPRPRAARPDEPAERPPRVRKPWLIPRTLGWIARHVPGAMLCTMALERLLAEAEMPGLVSAVPQTGRFLRPLCQMLRVKPPAFLALPRRVRAPRSSPRLWSASRPKPQRGEGEELPPHPAAARFPDTPAARSVARALARMQAGLPVDVSKLSAVAYGYFVHPPRDDNCPPPEVGYARRRWRVPKDYEPSGDGD